MPRNNNKAVFGPAQKVLDQFKYEVASEIGLEPKVQSQGWENMTTREVGAIGGYITKSLVAMALQQMASNPTITSQLAQSIGRDYQQGASRNSG